MPAVEQSLCSLFSWPADVYRPSFVVIGHFTPSQFKATLSDGCIVYSRYTTAKRAGTLIRAHWGDEADHY